MKITTEMKAEMKHHHVVMDDGKSYTLFQNTEGKPKYFGEEFEVRRNATESTCGNHYLKQGSKMFNKIKKICGV